MTTRRAALYLRVSTDEQTPENQRTACMRYAEARGLAVVTVRQEIESRDKRRPVLAELLAEADRRTFDALIVWALDRLGAGTVQIIQTVQRFDDRGVLLLSVQDGWLEMQGPARELLLGIMGWVSKQELLRIRERTRAGLERARRAGKRLGRPRRVSAMNRATMRTLAEDGVSVREISMMYKVPRSTVHRTLSRKG